MEGVGSARLGRISSRYGGASSVTAVFNGPVRKWKKKWVHVSSSPVINLKSHRTNGHKKNNSSKLLLCRWTPLSTTNSHDGGGDEQPRKRRFRYTPVAVLEEKERGVVTKIVEEEEEEEEEEANTFEKTKYTAALAIHSVSKNEDQGSSEGNLDLDLCLKGHDSSVEDKEGQPKGESSSAWVNAKYFI